MHSAAQAYARTAQKTANPRDLEAQLLLKAAMRIQSVIDGTLTEEADIVAALRYNTKLWTILAPSATEPNHPLPIEVKNNIANLAVFILSHTMSQMAAERVDPERLKVLVNINRELAAGLRGFGEAQAAQTSADPAQPAP